MDQWSNWDTKAIKVSMCVFHERLRAEAAPNAADVVVKVYSVRQTR